MFVVGAAALNADALGHGDLDMVDVAAVPYRLEDAVGEAEDQDVLDGLLPQVVVDAVYLVFVEYTVERAVQLRRAGQVMAERLLYDDARPAAVAAGQTRLAQALGDPGVLAGGRGQVVQAVARPGLAFDLLQPLGQVLVARWIVEL